MARINIDGVELTASLVTAHTINTGVQSTLIIMTFYNKDTVEHQIEVQFIPSGGSAADKYRIIGQKAGQQNSIQPGETQNYRENQFLDAGDFIQWKCDTTLKVSAKLSVLEEAV